MTNNLIEEVIYKDSDLLSLAELEKLLEKVPEEYKNSVRIEAEAYNIAYDEETYSRIRVWYQRPETDKEAKLTEDKRKQLLLQRELYEIQQLKQLQEKYKDKL